MACLPASPGVVITTCNKHGNRIGSVQDRLDQWSVRISFRLPPTTATLPRRARTPRNAPPRARRAPATLPPRRAAPRHAHRICCRTAAHHARAPYRRCTTARRTPARARAHRRLPPARHHTCRCTPYTHTLPRGTCRLCLPPDARYCHTRYAHCAACHPPLASPATYLPYYTCCTHAQHHRLCHMRASPGVAGIFYL